MTDTEGQEKNKVAYEVAEEDFERFADAWDLDIDIGTMTEEDAEDFAAQKRKIIRQIVQGRAAVNESGNIVYRLFEPVGTLSEVTLTRPRGRAYMDMDKAKEGKNVTKFTNLIAASIRQIPMIISRMDGVDVKFLQAVYTLFLGS